MPANTPRAERRTHPAGSGKALTQPDVRSRVAAMAYEGIGSTPADFAAFYKAEIAKFAKVIADANIPRQ